MEAAEPHIAGESVRLVFKVLQSLEVSPASNGVAFTRVGFKIGSPEGRAFRRALSRVVGRLSARDFAIELETGVVPRTEEQRQADALLDLIHQVGEALNQGEAKPTPRAFGKTREIGQPEMVAPEGSPRMDNSPA